MMTGNIYLIPLGFNFIKWLSDHILKPIIDLLVAILRPILDEFLKLVGDLLVNLLSGVFYAIYTVLLSVVDQTQRIFDAFSGAYQVYAPQSGKGGFVLRGYLTNFFINYGPVRTAFLAVFAISLLLCIIFTVLAVIRAAGDLEGRRSVGAVLNSLFRTLLTFITVQLFVLVCVSMSNIFLTSVNDAMLAASGNDSDIRVANVLFVSTAMDAAKSGAKPESVTDQAPWSEYYSGRKSYAADYALQSDFYATKVDYVTGYIAAAFLIFVMISSVFLFIQRVLEIVLLYVTAPFFVSSMPLDDGARFSAWRELFIAKCLSSYGIVASMRLFLIFLPIIMDPKIRYVSGNHTMDCMIRLLFVLGGCLAVKKGQSAILAILNPQAAADADSAMGGLMAVAGTVGSIAGGYGKAFKKGKK